MTRVAFSGVHRTGKTSLCEMLENLHGYRFYPLRISSLDVWKDHSVKPTDSFTFPERLKIQWKILEHMQKEFKELEKYNGDLVFDRSPIDAVAYLLVNTDQSELSLFEEEVRRFIRSSLDLTNAFFDKVFIVRQSDSVDRKALLSDSSKQGKEYSSFIYRKTIDLLICGIAEDLKSKTVIIPSNLSINAQRLLFIERQLLGK